VVNGKVYDVTYYLNYHPGGKDKLMLGIGQDCTPLFCTPLKITNRSTPSMGQCSLSSGKISGRFSSE